MEFKVGDRVIFKVLATRPIGTIITSKMLGKSKHFRVSFDSPLPNGRSTHYAVSEQLEIASEEQVRDE